MNIAVATAARGPDAVRDLVQECSGGRFLSPGDPVYLALACGALSGIHAANHAALLHEADYAGDLRRRRENLASLLHLPFEKDSEAILIKIHSSRFVEKGLASVAKLFAAAAMRQSCHHLAAAAA